MNGAGFSVSGRAAARIAELAGSSPEAPALRIGVEAGGCSGFQYRFELVSRLLPDDVVICQAGARVFIDRTSLGLLAGAELDFTDELIGSHFTVRNPNATSSCGCGSSFSID